jgi:hypothetical protein
MSDPIGYGFPRSRSIRTGPNADGSRDDDLSEPAGIASFTIRGHADSSRDDSPSSAQHSAFEEIAHEKPWPHRNTQRPQ